MIKLDMSKNLPKYSLSDVAEHNTEKSIWVVIGSCVYDLTTFSKYHPGGKPVILRYAGKDCTDEFNQLHNERVLNKYHKQLLIGYLQDGIKNERKIILYKSPSQYYNDSHTRFREAVKKLV
eukprot:GHVL01042571.1.p2 GENE.GHVL01042571.1~~GHVL01042571.1.p2  ORF type:complete len:121 (+),score=31.88 GHVL01042571.1:45-407(+)